MGRPSWEGSATGWLDHRMHGHEAVRPWSGSAIRRHDHGLDGHGIARRWPDRAIVWPSRGLAVPLGDPAVGWMDCHGVSLPWAGPANCFCYTT